MVGKNVPYMNPIEIWICSLDVFWHMSLPRCFIIVFFQVAIRQNVGQYLGSTVHLCKVPDILFQCAKRHGRPNYLGASLILLTVCAV